jgi:hypothetical protein
MTDPVEPTRPTSAVRRILRRVGAAGTDLVRAGGAADGQGSAANLPAIAATPLVEPHEPNAAAAFAAQVMGQGGHKRGLRGGDETLERARSTYLETEYSGPADRRLRRGRITRTEI